MRKCTALLLVATVLLAGCNAKQNKKKREILSDEPATLQVRFATFNTALNCEKAGDLAKRLADKDSDKGGQARKIAEIIQRVRPDVILLNEFDRDQTADEPDQALALFRSIYLGTGQSGQQPISYQHCFVARVNTGLDSGVDLNNNDKMGESTDAFGFGQFSGKYAMVVLSRYPIDEKRVRTFQTFLWKDMPDAKWPINPETGKHYYSDEAKSIFRLSSKSHWDLPIKFPNKTVHFICAHPTPPVFDGPEDRNGRRNHDEIRLIADYVNDEPYIYDDQGKQGGIGGNASFVIAGDMNADPADGASFDQAANLLTRHPLVNFRNVPNSLGGVEVSKKSGGINRQHQGDPAFDTADFDDETAGNMRVDYVLPSRDLVVVDSGVFWPPSDVKGADIIDASDHRLVWVDVELEHGKD